MSEQPGADRDIDRMAPADLLPRRLALLRRQVAYARDRCDFYREHLAAVDARGLRAWDDLARIPFLRREDLAAHYARMVCAPPAQLTDMYRTSGSSGQSIFMPVSRTDMRRAAKSMARGLRRLGIQAGERFMIMLPLDEMICPSIIVDHSFRHDLQCQVLRVGLPAIEKQVDYLRALRPAIILSAPTPALRLGQRLREQGVDPRALGIRMLLVTGQPVYRDGWQPNALLRGLREAWGIDVVSLYGSTEYGAGMVCAAGQGHHVLWDHMLFEIVDPESGTPLQEGVGELVFSGLTREAIPLIRYRTGDITWIERAPCACGLTSPRVMAVLARADQMLKIKGARFYPQEVEEEVLSVPGVRAHMIEVYRDGHDQDLLRVRVQAEGDVEGALAEVARRVKARTRVTPQVEAASLAELERLWYRHGGTKPLRFHDQRPG